MTENGKETPEEFVPEVAPGNRNAMNPPWLYQDELEQAEEAPEETPKPKSRAKAKDEDKDGK